MSRLRDRYDNATQQVAALGAPLRAAFDKAVEGLSPRDRLLLGGLVVCLCLALLTLASMAMTRSLRGLEGMVATRQSQYDMVQEMGSSYAEASAKLQDLEERVNAHKTTTLSAFLEQCADKVQIRDNLKQVKERSVSVAEDLEEKQYAVQLSRVTLDQFSSFLYETETAGYPMLIKSAKVKTTVVGGVKVLDVTLDISAYKIVESKEAEG